MIEIDNRDREIAKKGELANGIIQLIYIGEDFYSNSGSFISPLYTVDGQRYDYGFMQIALKCGKNVNIRQATPVEIKFFTDKLEQIKKTKAEYDNNMKED